MAKCFVLRGQQGTIEEVTLLFEGKTGAMIEIKGKEEFVHSPKSELFRTEEEAEVASKKKRAEFAKYSNYGN